MKMLYFITFILFIGLGCEEVQKINLPYLNEVELIERPYYFIPIGLNYNKESRLQYHLGNLITTKIDSVKNYILRENEKKPWIYSYFSIEIIADEGIEMYDFEYFQEELKRLGISKVFYTTYSIKKLPKANEHTSGFKALIAQRDEENINQFYENRKLKYKEPEDIYLIAGKKDVFFDEEKITFPSRPVLGPPSKFSEKLKKRFNNFEVIRIHLDKKNIIKIGSQEYTIKELSQYINKKLSDKKCVFILSKGESTKYGLYIKVLGTIQDKLRQLRNKEAINNHGGLFNSLNSSMRITIMEKIRMIVIDEPIYVNNYPR